MNTYFNPNPPTIMHVDLNSCFATVEQQANPLLRGRPIAVAAYTEDHGCILAASVEAKRMGIKTGMRVYEARKLSAGLVVLSPDPEKYRWVNRKLLALLGSYSSDISVESIDEMVMNLWGSPKIQVSSSKYPFGLAQGGQVSSKDIEIIMIKIAKEIKQRIKAEIGDWLTVSIGIAPNRYLAKVASGLHKPDGLDFITGNTIEDILSHLKLEDLCGIKEGNANRLRIGGIYTPLAMYEADNTTLSRAFHSIMGSHWYSRLHGYEDGSMYKAFGSGEDNPDGAPQKSFGQSYAMGQPHLPQEEATHQILSQLVLKMGRRLRAAGCVAHGIGVSTLFIDHSHWGKREMSESPVFSDADFYDRMKSLLIQAPANPVRILAIYTHRLERSLYVQDTLFEEETKRTQLTKALDKVADRWGEFTVTPARMLRMHEHVQDRIAFGKVRGLKTAISG